MSYSFRVRGSSVEAALQGVKENLDNVVAGQPVHAAETPFVMAAAEGFVNALIVEADKDIDVSINGSVYGSPEGGLRSASVSLSVGLVAKE